MKIKLSKGHFCPRICCVRLTLDYEKSSWKGKIYTSASCDYLAEKHFFFFFIFVFASLSFFSYLRSWFISILFFLISLSLTLIFFSFGSASLPLSIFLFSTLFRQMITSHHSTYRPSPLSYFFITDASHLLQSYINFSFPPPLRLPFISFLRFTFFL